MRALTAYRDSLCPICGNSKTVCQAAENSDRFTVPPPSRCHATTAIRKESEKAERDVPDALVWSAQLRA